jgi:carboxylesterase type B
LNIFGYPDAAALNGENLNPGLMDHRKAIEWVYQNIHAFGGNADQMILFGQSAGFGLFLRKTIMEYTNSYQWCRRR